MNREKIQYNGKREKEQRKVKEIKKKCENKQKINKNMKARKEKKSMFQMQLRKDYSSAGL